MTPFGRMVVPKNQHTTELKKASLRIIADDPVKQKELPKELQPFQSFKDQISALQKISIRTTNRTSW